MPAILDAARRFKRQLAEREAATMRTMANGYLGIINRLERELDEVARLMAEQRALGRAITPAYLYRNDRYRQLIAQANTEFMRYEESTAILIAREQATLARLGRQQALELVEMQSPGISAAFNRLPVSAVENIAGFVADTSPLRRLLNDAWPHAIDQTTQALVDGVALGYGPRKIARMMRDGIGGGLKRSLVIARTEPLRAYRTSTLETWRAIPEGRVIGYQRVAAHSVRTCPACLMDDGRFYKISEGFPEHPQGRCSFVPVLKGQDQHEWKTGQAWLEGQSASTQQSILGKQRYEAWKGGNLALQDIPQRVPNSTWGPSLRSRTASELGGVARAPSIDYAKASLDDMVTVQDVEKWANARYSHIHFDFADTDINAMRPTMRQFDKLAGQYPDVAKRLEYIGTYRGPGSPNATFNNAIAHASQDGKRIGLNSEYYSNAENFSRTQRENLLANWTDADGTIESVMTHEFGHMVENWLLATNRNFIEYAGGDDLGVVRGTVYLFNKKFKPTEKLSRYAVTTNSIKTAPSGLSAFNRVEGWAESFAAIHHKPAREWPLYVKRLNRLLDEIADPDTWRDVQYLHDLGRGTSQREAAVKALAELRKKLELD